ncbi:hypothetical protein QAD02_010366 [Eretmocerus hayati]|uniref:Uncharacterized protein n=1 Tax=Eretmocerus hayati TaxID=131215 RepID=A0ACC2ND47_9HYME|nr:hypothetical protein QAD02_010366 [Eretmocerus hayati]
MTPLSFVKNKILLALIIWRVSSAFIVQTFHVPDEYWQSLEVAHKLAFDYGYLTWEWRSAIRSYLYPCMISVLYSVMRILKVDYTFMITMAPRICHALLSAYADYKFYQWTQSKIALLSLCINWYWYYCASRTLINSFETCLTIIALSVYPWRNSSNKNWKFLSIVGFLCFARPTAAIFWLPLCLYHIFRNPKVIFEYIKVGLVTAIISTVIDIICYRAVVFTPFNFVVVNVINGISEQYGRMHVLWYLFSGLPVVVGINSALLVIALYRALGSPKKFPTSFILSLTVLWSLVLYSLISHKEFRFILPILPMNQKQSVDDICEALDDLTIKHLDLLEEKISKTIKLENLLRQGHIDLARARYIRGKESVSLLQIPSIENGMKSLYELETTIDEGDSPVFDISLKTKDGDDGELQNPVNWFGVLVPQSLRAAQKYFQNALYLVVELANIQVQLKKTQDEVDRFTTSKEVQR